MDFSKVVKMD